MKGQNKFLLNWKSTGLIIFYSIIFNFASSALHTMGHINEAAWFCLIFTLCFDLFCPTHLLFSGKFFFLRKQEAKLVTDMVICLEANQINVGMPNLKWFNSLQKNCGFLSRLREQFLIKSDSPKSYPLMWLLQREVIWIILLIIEWYSKK